MKIDVCDICGNYPCTCYVHGTNTGKSFVDYTFTLSACWDDYAKKIMNEAVAWSLKMKNKNPHVPKVIYSDPLMETTVVEWEDGTKTKVSCAAEDEYSWEGGFYAALAIKVFGGKKADMKNKWLPVLSRRVLEMGSKITPLPYGKWEDEKKVRKHLEKVQKEIEKQVKRDELKNGKNTKKAKGSKRK